MQAVLELAIALLVLVVLGSIIVWDAKTERKLKKAMKKQQEIDDDCWWF
jgi:hypothetical protein